MVLLMGFLAVAKVKIFKARSERLAKGLRA